jgi:putative phosphoesterase
MILGILSDTHDNIENTRRALAVFKRHRVEFIIHCGDITIPQVVELFDGWQVAFVFGNLDAAETHLLAAAGKLGEPASMGHRYTGIIGGASVAAYHGNDDEYLSTLIESGQYDYVFYGHTHLRRDEKIGRTRVINPGSLGGRKKETRSVCVLSLPNGAARFIEVAGD